MELTNMQKNIVNIIRGCPGISVSDIAAAIYHGKRYSKRPIQPSNTINVLIRRINKRSDKFQIVSDGGKGRAGKKVWLVKK